MLTESATDVTMSIVQRDSSIAKQYCTMVEKWALETRQNFWNTSLPFNRRQTTWECMIYLVMLMYPVFCRCDLELQLMTLIFWRCTGLHVLRSAACGYLLVPRVRMVTHGPCRFAVSEPCVWNDLPPTVCTSSGALGQFQGRLRTMLLCLVHGT